VSDRDAFRANSVDAREAARKAKAVVDNLRTAYAKAEDAPKPDDRAEMQERRQYGLAKRHEQRLENATYTAAEVKVLTEAALRLGRKEAGEEIAERIEALAGTPTMRGTMAGEMLLSCAKTARDLTSLASGATSDASSGVGGHQEVSEAARSPQDPCGHYKHNQEAG